MVVTGKMDVWRNQKRHFTGESCFPLGVLCRQYCKAGSVLNYLQAVAIMPVKWTDESWSVCRSSIASIVHHIYPFGQQRACICINHGWVRSVVQKKCRKLVCWRSW